MLHEYRALEEEILVSLREERADFDALALAVHAFQRRWNRPFANFCATHPEPTTWRAIPAVPQSIFKQFTLSVAPEAVTRTFHSSGTTGHRPSMHGFIDLQLYEASIQAGWRRLGLPRQRHLVLVPPPAVAPHSSLSHMMATLDREAAGTIWGLDHDGQFAAATLAALREAEASGAPLTVLGTALAFLHLFERLGAERVRLPSGSLALETGGFKGSGRDIEKAELYRRFGEFLDLPPEAVLNEYGMTELSSQFYSRGLGRPHSAPPWVRAVVFAPETGREVAVGEMGVLRLFDLANLGSVIGLETQDLAIRREEGFELIGRDPAALPRGCSLAADELLQRR